MARPKIAVDAYLCAKLYSSGKSCLVIAERFRVDRQTIANRLKEIGITCRSASVRHIGKGNPRWKGGKWSRRDGYRFITTPDGKIQRKLEHRKVIEDIIGRELKSNEPVHHLGEKNDNSPNMLMAFINNSAHTRFEHGKAVKPEEIIFDGRAFVATSVDDVIKEGL